MLEKIKADIESFRRIYKLRILEDCNNIRYIAKVKRSVKLGVFKPLQIDLSLPEYEQEELAMDWIAYAKDKIFRKLKDNEKKRKKKRKRKSGQLPPKKQTLIKELDSLVAEYVKTLRCREDTGNPNKGHCCTCGVLSYRPYDKGDNGLQWGHCFSRVIQSIRYSIINTDIQCSSCNGAGKGKPIAFRSHIIKKHGEARRKELERVAEKYDPTKDALTVNELIELKEHFTKELADLKEKINKQRLLKE